MWNSERSEVVLHQTIIVKKLTSMFREEIATLRTYYTPFAPLLCVQQPDPDGQMTDVRQSKFRTGVGTLLYLIKHSRPYLSNSVRELSKVMMRGSE